MNPGEVLYFAPFCIELGKRQLRRGEEKVELRPKSVLVLAYLVSRAGEVVTTEEVLQAVWAGTHVTRGVIPVCVREIRQALGDEASAPRYIETIGREGYRFIPPLSATPPVVSSQYSVASIEKTAVQYPQLITDNWQLTTPLVGREADLAHLYSLFAKALHGERQLVFVTGEAGIGKTTVVDAFLQSLESRVQRRASEQGQSPRSKIQEQIFSPISNFQSPTPGPWIGWGQCIEHYGAGEAYLPVLDALGRLGRQAGRARVLEVLRRQAPSWLAQLPALIDKEELAAVQRMVQGVARERMLRELAEALEGLAVERPVVLILEDLHWSDRATVELLSFLARRRERARLLVVGTYRMADIVIKGHPLRAVKQELQGHGLCEELALNLLTQEDVLTYLRKRMGGSPIPAELGRVVHQRTDGNALFMVDFVEYLVQRKLLVEEQGQWVLPQGLKAIESGVPDSLQQLVTKQVEELPSEVQRVLEAASVAGVSFATETVAAGLGVASQNIDTVCEELAQQGQFIEERELEEWPDGTLTASYAFHHAFYPQVLCERLGILQRVRLHRLMGERKEAGYREQAADIAAELAVHFEQGRIPEQAVRYHQHASTNALRRSAYDEARKHYEQGLSLLTKLHDATLRARHEIALRLILNNVQTITLGFTAVELEQNLQQARQLCHVANNPTLQVTVLIRLGRVYLVRADRRAMEDLAEQDRRLLGQQPDPALAIQLHSQLGKFTLYRGEYAQAQHHWAQILALFDPALHRALTFSVGIDPAVDALCFAAWSSCLTGYLDQARRQVEQSVALAEAIAHPFSLVSTLTFTRLVLNCCGELEQSRQFTERSIALANKHGFPLYAVWALIGQGSVAVLRGDAETGLTKLREGLIQYRATGAQLTLPYYLSLLAEAYRQMEKPAEGLQVVMEALQLVETNLDVFWAAELHRLKGELILKQSGVRSPASEVPNTQPPTPSPQAEVEAEACFLKAIEIARQQQAKSLELRAVLSLSRLWQQRGKRAAARQLLAETYGWFTEGFDTPDLRAAQALLGELS